VLNRWRKVCPSCFDTEAEKEGVRYKFTDVEAVSWSERPVARSRPNRRRRGCSDLYRDYLLGQKAAPRATRC